MSPLMKKYAHVIQTVTLIEEKMDELRHERSEMLDPVLARVKDMTDEELLWWLDNLPECSHRVELWRESLTRTINYTNL